MVSGNIHTHPTGSSISAAMPYETPPILIRLPEIRLGACSAFRRMNIAMPTSAAMSLPSTASGCYASTAHRQIADLKAVARIICALRSLAMCG
jgi:hypothetical protein